MIKFIKLPIPLLMIAIGGCMNKPFQPSPAAWDKWVLQGATVMDVRIAMLECGYDFDNPPSKIEDAILVNRCMKKSGFRRNEADRIDLSFDSSCRNYRELEPCKLSIDEVPGRDQARRLNSIFCKKNKDAQICQP